MGNYGGSDLVGCPQCKALIPPSAEKCPDCGKVFQLRTGMEDGLERTGKSGTPYSWADHRTCSKCGGVLEKGFLDDQFSNKAYLDLMWTSGDPEENPPDEHIDRRQFFVTALRCTRCGSLELKALDGA
jgi:phage FluMu protein Com